MRISRPLAAVVLPLALLAAGCADDEKASTDTAESGATTTTAAAEGGGSAAAPELETIVGVATGSGTVSTLTDLVVKAGLAEALSGEGPFTVFAPTNAAFGAVDPATLATLAADPTGALADVLKLHVVAGKITAADIPEGGTVVETLNGGKLRIDKMGDAVMIGDVKVIAPDVEASNGVIHVIDGVITAPNA